MGDLINDMGAVPATHKDIEEIVQLAGGMHRPLRPGQCGVNVKPEYLDVSTGRTHVMAR